METGLGQPIYLHDRKVTRNACTTKQNPRNICPAPFLVIGKKGGSKVMTEAGETCSCVWFMATCPFAVCRGTMTQSKVFLIPSSWVHIPEIDILATLRLALKNVNSLVSPVYTEEICYPLWK